MTYIYDGLLSGMSEEDLYDHFCGEEARKRQEEREAFEQRIKKIKERENAK